MKEANQYAGRRRQRATSRAQVQKLRRERNLLRALVSSIQDEVWFADSQKRLSLVNPAGLAEFRFADAKEGINFEQLISTLKILEVDGTPRPLEQAPALRALRGELVRGLQELVQTADGKLRYREVNAAPVRDAAGRILGSVTVVRDVTERRHMAQAIAESEARYRGVFKCMREAFFVADVITDEAGAVIDLQIVEANQAKADQTGIPVEQLTSKTMLELIPDLEPKFLEMYGRAALEGETLHFEQYAQGPKRHYQVSAYQVRPGRFASMLVDITERKQMEAELREREEHLRLMVDHTPGALILLDRELRYLRSNRGMFENLGLEYRDLRGRWLYAEVPDLPEHWKAAHRRALAGEVVRGEDRLTRPGPEKWVQWEDRPWRDADGRIGGIMIFAADITEQKRVEQVLQQQREQLQALNRRLIEAREAERAAIARDLHDLLGQLLTAIKFDLHWVPRHLPAEYADVHKRLAETLKLVNDGIRTVQTLCTGLRPGILDDLGLVAALQWEAREFAERTGLRCTVSVPERDPELHRDAATAVFRIFQECLTNVARHAQAHVVQARLSCTTVSLRLLVVDDGRGFSQADAAGSLGFLGMKERAQGCGGSVSILGVVGKGTRVAVRIPMQAAGKEA